jgi:hypothetical protein
VRILGGCSNNGDVRRHRSLGSGEGRDAHRRVS